MPMRLKHWQEISHHAGKRPPPMRSHIACTAAGMNISGGAYMRDLEPDKLPFETIRLSWCEDSS